MLNRTQRRKIYDGIPTYLCNLNIHKELADTHPNRPETYPLILITFLTEGNRKSMGFQNLHDRCFGGHWVTDVGHYASGTMSITIDSPDLVQLQDIGFEMYQKIWSTELGISVVCGDNIWFRGVEKPIFSQPYLEPGARKQIFRCTIDVYFEYEMTWERIDPSILTIGTKVDVSGRGIVEGTVDLYTCVIGGYLMETSIVSDNIKYLFNTILEQTGNEKSYPLSVLIRS